MVEYEHVCYLDVQKTGSTFVQSFLERHMRGEPLRVIKHGRIAGRADPETFCFITCRRPLDLYLSLFSSGCDGRGALRRRLVRAGLSNLYERTPGGLARWLEFVLEERNASFLGEGYADGRVELYGFQTHRFLSLALGGAAAKLSKAEGSDDLRRLFARRTIVDAVLSTERLDEGLAELARTDLRPHLVDADAALAALQAPKRLNVSTHDELTDVAGVPEALVRQIERREWFLHELMGYARGGEEASGAHERRPAVLRVATRRRSATGATG